MDARGIALMKAIAQSTMENSESTEIQPLSIISGFNLTCDGETAINEDFGLCLVSDVPLPSLEDFIGAKVTFHYKGETYTRTVISYEDLENASGDYIVIAFEWDSPHYFSLSCFATDGGNKELAMCFPEDTDLGDGDVFGKGIWTSLKANESSMPWLSSIVKAPQVVVADEFKDFFDGLKSSGGIDIVRINLADYGMDIEENFTATKNKDELIRLITDAVQNEKLIILRTTSGGSPGFLVEQFAINGSDDSGTNAIMILFGSKTESYTLTYSIDNNMVFMSKE